MTEQRWQQIEEIYHAALEIPPEQRASYVSGACRGDTELLAEVQSLLARDASSPDHILNHPVIAPPTVTQMSRGTRLGPYEIESPLGAGGMGEVWKARDTRLGRIVALKISKKEFDQRFEREARAVAALNHHNIATLYDVGPNYFVMEYVEGKPLQLVIQRKGLPLAQVLAYATQIADALAAAHAAGIVHRDLKPGNIMITNEGRVKVVDFGLAHVTTLRQQSPNDPTFTQTAEGTIAGTVSYMSPEQAQGLPIDARSDIFSFGAVLYEMITGTRAFHGDSPMSTMADVLNKDPRPVREIRGELPREVETLLNRCLRKDPARRWQNMADLKVALLELKEESESGRLNAAVPAVARRKGIHPAWLAGALSVALIAAGAGWYFTRGRQPATAPSQAVPLTSYPGEQTRPSFSPDGNQVAFSWNGPLSDNWDIYVKVVGEGEPLRLTSNAAVDNSPAWSPDGRWIAFEREIPGDRYALLLISPLGGVERKLGEFGAPVGVHPDFSWSKDSKYLIIPIREEARNGLFRFTVETGEMLQLVSLDPGAAGASGTALSPDGRQLAFNILTALTLGRLHVIDLADDLSPIGKPRLIAPKVVARPAWTPDSKELIYATGPTMTAATLRRISLRPNAIPQAIGMTGDTAYQPAVSSPKGRAGASLAWTHFSQDSNVYRVELSGPAQAAGKPEVLIGSTFRDVFPQYSPDGKMLAFYSARSGVQEIWTCQTDGSSPRQLTRLGGPVSATPRWSPDGRQIVFDSDRTGVYQIYMTTAEGAKPKQLTEGPSANFGANWAPDGKWLYFTSNRSGALNIWKMPASGGTAEQVTRNGGNMPTLSADGKFLFYAKSREIAESSLWRVPLSSAGSDAGATMLVDRIHRFSYAVTEHGVYFSVPQPARAAGATIEYLDFASGKRSIIERTDKSLDSGLAISPDRRSLLYCLVDGQGSNLMILENFR